MSRRVADYIARITPWQSTRQRFVTTVAAVLAPTVDAGAVSASLPDAFDLDTAIGAQLDVVGEWVGRARTVALPLPNIYFALDDERRGLDFGVLKGPYDTAIGITSLDDETYRRLLRANILAKRWDGTVPDAQAAFDVFFTDPETHVFVQDNAQVPYPKAFFALDAAGQGLDEGLLFTDGDMSASVGAVDVSMTIGISGKMPPLVYLGILAQGGIPIKPAGVATTYEVTSVDGAPLFGLDVQNEFVAGLDTGALGVSPASLLAA